MENFVLSGTLKNSTEPLMKMKNIRFSFNLIDIYHKKYYFKTLSFEEGQLNVKINADGKNNFDLFRKGGNKNQEGDMEIRKIKLKKIEINYEHQKEKSFSHFLVDNVLIENKTQNLHGDMEINGEMLAKSIKLTYDRFPETLPVEFSVVLNLNPKEKKIISRDCQLTVKNIKSEITFEFSYASHNYYKSFIKIDDSRIKDVFSIVPDGWTEDVSPYLTEGIGDLKINLYGSTDYSPPHLSIEFQCRKSVISDAEKKWKIENAEFIGTFSNGEGREPGTSSLNITRLTGLFLERNITSTFIMRNFYNPWISATFEGSMNMTRLNDFYPIKNIAIRKGELDFSLQWEGRPGSNAPAFMSNILQRAKFTGNEIAFSYTDSTHIKPDNFIGSEINDFNFECEWMPGKINFQKLSFNTQKSDFLLTETSLQIPNSNSLSWMCTTTIHSKKTDLQELVNIIQTINSSSENSKSLPLSLVLNVSCNQLIVENMKAEDFKLLCDYKSDNINFHNFSFSSFGGTITPEVEIRFLNPIQKQINGKLILEKINLKKLFSAFSKMRSDYLSENNFEGALSGEIRFETLLDTSNLFDWHKTKGMADLNISSGKLLHYKPLQKLARFADVELLDNLTFNEIKSVFSFENGNLTFPETEITSNVTTLWFNGTVSKTQEFDMHVKIRLPKHKRRKKIQEDELGVIEDDGLGNTLLFIKITGKPEKLNIVYDTEAVKNRIKDAWEKEKKEFKDIFKRKTKQDSIKTLKLSEEEFKLDE
ncbi:MAG: hypothetical protein A3H98_13240 [Bacteroidetes bacterium RIFCSPLOWO2_02_FULL_36_8]|nr:MAG: hypothetical protein A3H98_13240 [Bacteroidetes bacterium RIFCSPLOWO2_02_FULL_36_8]OFY69957.1 MAG: hypothetical protein A3G23_05735 [Bacteroidetes bacterium RIFCSPLOWO2_12_FULL_37_12]